MPGAQLVTALRDLGLWRRVPPPWAAGQVVAKDPQGAAPWRRTLAATGSPDAADAVAEAWDTLPPPVRAAVLDPVRALAHAGRQVTERTCGPAVLTMLAAAGDPLLALWLASGRLLGPERPDELVGAPDAALRRLAAVTPDARFAVVHRVVHRRATARAVWGLDWPESLGTPPWALAGAARFLGVRFRHVVVDDTAPAYLSDVLARVAAALDAGVPVPLFTGGDSGQGWRAAVPRHVVLAVGRDGDGLRIWEPARGEVLRASATVLRGGRADPALGGWRHVVWAVLPA